MTATIHQLKPKPAILECSNCGATTSAACPCGVSYVPAGTRAADAIAADPGKSNRAIAAELGVDEATVRAARKKSGAEYSAPATVVGKDGKSYPAKGKTVEPLSVRAKLIEDIRAAWPKLPDDDREALVKEVNWLAAKADGQ